MNLNAPIEDSSKWINQDCDEENTKQLIEQLENDEEALRAEDLDDDYYLNLNNEKTSIFELFEFSPKGSMQNLPEIPPFAIFSHSGAIMKVSPSIYDKIPMKDIFHSLHILFIFDMNFGDIWKHPQTRLFKDYDKIEDQSYRLLFIEQAIREWISTGKISRRSPIPFSESLPPLYGLKAGRFLESQVIFGLNPLPISVGATKWKILNYENVLKSIERINAQSRKFKEQINGKT
ncbi:MAG: hypothetical protein EZS28_002988 [Streblomastix strix]|uniref:Uncharacterized protein n=1 Tax=Streblomastix strix TaxID=222440 RepID=A0A5J4X493_9EUKA|nr:MAG: hypothetical protein EZS28_002988 [Streblomastix strix]